MTRLFQTIDNLLRGGFTQREDLAAGDIKIRVRALVVASILLGAAYGVFMGLYACVRPASSNYAQLAATIVKVPALFLLTLVVTYPSLYILSALAGSRLRFLQTLRLVMVATTVNTAVLASLGPVTAFFTLSTDSYPFMILLNVAIFGVSGVIGLKFLWKAMDAVFSVPDASASKETDGPEPVPTHSRRPRSIFNVWLLIFAVVGMQMSWILRPFIGNPDLPFELFRQSESNFFEAVITVLRKLFAS